MAGMSTGIMDFLWSSPVAMSSRPCTALSKAALSSARSFSTTGSKMDAFSSSGENLGHSSLSTAAVDEATKANKANGRTRDILRCALSRWQYVAPKPNTNKHTWRQV